MSLVRQFLERRASPENPSTNLSNPDSWLYDAFGATASATGVRVSEMTALRSTAVFACVRVLAESVASLPLQVVREREDGTGEDVAKDHPLYRILHDRPNPEMSAFTFRETMMGHVALWGNAYAEIEMSTGGRVLGLWPMRPDSTAPRRAANGERYYETLVNGRHVLLSSNQVLHIKGLGFDGLKGYSPIALHRQAVGLALAAEEFGARFFGNSAQPSGILTHPGKLSPEAKQRLKSSWEAAQGGLSNAQRTALLEEGLTWQALGVPQKDAQFLETRQMQVTEIARIFRIQPHKIGDLGRATWGNVEHENISHVVDTIRPWLIRWEQDMDWGLFSDRDRWKATCKFNVEAMLRGDSAQRSAFYRAMFEIGVMSINEIRAKESLNPVKDGDLRFVTTNAVTLESAKAPKPAPAPTPAPAAPDPEAVRSAVEGLLLDVAQRLTRREATQMERSAKRSRDDFGTWATEFYADHGKVIREAVTPSLRAAALLAGCARADALALSQELADVIAAAWTGRGREDALALAGQHSIVTWERGMPDAIATWERTAIEARAQLATTLVADRIAGAAFTADERKAA